MPDQDMISEDLSYRLTRRRPYNRFSRQLDSRRLGRQLEKQHRRPRPVSIRHGFERVVGWSEVYPHVGGADGITRCRVYTCWRILEFRAKRLMSSLDRSTTEEILRRSFSVR